MLEVKRFRDTGLLCAVSFLLLAVAVMGGAEQRPNVLMICIDDLNDWVGYLGGHQDAYAQVYASMRTEASSATFTVERVL